MNEKRSWVFGAGEDCDVRIEDDEYVSTKHCKVTLTEDGSVWVEDLGSTNGTWVRAPSEIAPGRFPGMRVHGPMPLPHGWVIRIGNTDVPWKRGGL